jgi:hypothetical protein
MLKSILVATVFAAALPAMGAPTKSQSSSKSSKAMSESQSTVSVDKPRFEIAGEPVRIQPTVGLAMFDLDGAKGAHADQGMTVAALADIGSGATVFQTGLRYIQAGAAGSESGVNVTIQLDYIGAEAAVKHYFYGHQAYFKAGAMPMLNTRHRAKATFQGRTVEGSINNTSDYDIMAQGAIGIQVPTGNPGVDAGAELSVSRGLVNVNSGSGDSIYNQGFMFSGFVSL